MISRILLFIIIPSLVYDPNEPEDDMKEREEEMERMREHVFKESDTNKDHLISFDEFMTETKRDEFENDPGWDTMDQDEDEVSSNLFGVFYSCHQNVYYMTILS